MDLLSGNGLKGWADILVKVRFRSQTVTFRAVILYRGWAGRENIDDGWMYEQGSLADRFIIAVREKKGHCLSTTIFSGHKAERDMALPGA